MSRGKRVKKHTFEWYKESARHVPGRRYNQEAIDRLVGEYMQIRGGLVLKERRRYCRRVMLLLINRYRWEHPEMREVEKREGEQIEEKKRYYSEVLGDGLKGWRERGGDNNIRLRIKRKVWELLKKEGEKRDMSIPIFFRKLAMERLQELTKKP